jgi:hypothetical protein
MMKIVGRKVNNSGNGQNQWPVSNEIRDNRFQHDEEQWERYDQLLVEWEVISNLVLGDAKHGICISRFLSHNRGELHGTGISDNGI